MRQAIPFCFSRSFSVVSALVLSLLTSFLLGQGYPQQEQIGNVLIQREKDQVKITSLTANGHLAPRPLSSVRSDDSNPPNRPFTVSDLADFEKGKIFAGCFSRQLAREIQNVLDDVFSSSTLFLQLPKKSRPAVKTFFSNYIALEIENPVDIYWDPEAGHYRSYRDMDQTCTWDIADYSNTPAEVFAYPAIVLLLNKAVAKGFSEKEIREKFTTRYIRAIIGPPEERPLPDNTPQIQQEAIEFVHRYFDLDVALRMLHDVITYTKGYINPQTGRYYQAELLEAIRKIRRGFGEIISRRWKEEYEQYQQNPNQYANYGYLYVLWSFAQSYNIFFKERYPLDWFSQDEFMYDLPPSEFLSYKREVFNYWRTRIGCQGNWAKVTVFHPRDDKENLEGVEHCFRRHLKIIHATDSDTRKEVDSKKVNDLDLLIYLNLRISSVFHGIATTLFNQLSYYQVIYSSTDLQNYKDITRWYTFTPPVEVLRSLANLMKTITVEDMEKAIDTALSQSLFFLDTLMITGIEVNDLGNDLHVQAVLDLQTDHLVEDILGDPAISFFEK